MKTIDDLKKAVEYYKIFLSLDQIRKLEKWSIVFSTRNPENNYREFSSEQFQISIKNILRYYYNVPLDVIQKGDEKELEIWAKIVMKGVKQI